MEGSDGGGMCEGDGGSETQGHSGFLLRWWPADLRGVVVLTQSSQYLQYIRKRRTGKTLSPLVGLKVSIGPAAADGERGWSTSHNRAEVVHSAVHGQVHQRQDGKTTPHPVPPQPSGTHSASQQGTHAAGGTRV